MTAPLPLVDVHEMTIGASRSDVFDAVRRHATKSLRFGARNPIPVLLGTDPRSGFSVEHLVEDKFIVLVGSHRFSQYQLRFDVDPAAGQLDPSSLAACAGVMLRPVATERGLVIRDGSVLAEGDLDFRGTLGIDRDAPVGFGDIRLSFSLDTEETTSRPTGIRQRSRGVALERMRLLSSVTPPALHGTMWWDWSPSVLVQPGTAHPCSRSSRRRRSLLGTVRAERPQPGI